MKSTNFTKHDAEIFKSIHGFYPITGGDGAGEAPAFETIVPAEYKDAPFVQGVKDIPGFFASVKELHTKANATPAGFDTMVPEEFKAEPWMKDVKDVPTLLARMKDTTTKLGAAGAGLKVPTKDSKPEEIAAFRKATGVPDKAEAYVFTDPPKELGPANPEFQTAIKGMFHKHGISAEQASGLQKDWDALQLEAAKKNGTIVAELDKNFDTLKAATFGGRADDAIKGARILISKYAPAAMKAHVAKLDNENLIILASVLDGVRKDFITEDKMPKDGGTPPGGMNDDQKRAKGRELMASEAYKNQFHADHEKVKKEVQELYGTAPK